jgi:hypothetical protein
MLISQLLGGKRQGNVMPICRQRRKLNLMQRKEKTIIDDKQRNDQQVSYMLLNSS